MRTGKIWVCKATYGCNIVADAGVKKIKGEKTSMKASIKATKLKSWLKLIQATQPEEISCSECFEHVSTYVELEVTGEPAPKLMPQLKQHIDQCQVCREEYELIRELAQAEAEEHPPEVEELKESIRQQRGEE